MSNIILQQAHCEGLTSELAGFRITRNNMYAKGGLLTLDGELVLFEEEPSDDFIMAVLMAMFEDFSNEEVIEGRSVGLSLAFKTGDNPDCHFIDVVVSSDGAFEEEIDDGVELTQELIYEKLCALCLEPDNCLASAFSETAIRSIERC